MKYVSLFAAAVLLTTTVEAGSGNCCQVRSCNPCGSSQRVTRWYKAKDGTLREMIPYRQALSRAEDADDMEIALRGAQEELASVQEAATAAQEDLKAQLAALQQQLEQQVAATASEKARADKAEAAHQAAATQVAQLQETQKQSAEALTAAQAELTKATAAQEELSAKVASLTKERDALTAQVSTATSEIERLKQEAAKNEEVAIATEKYNEDPSDDEAADDDAPAEEQPTEEEGQES